jgi:hypothetical protein
MNEEKRDFLKHKLIPLLRRIPSDRPPVWGKMTLQQMVEHFSDYVRIASGKTAVKDIHTPSENLQRMRDFLLSEKPFKENTPNPLMAEVPPPVRNPSVESAVGELQTEINFFFSVFEKNNLQTTRNPFFGDLNYEENIQLLHKHALHHLKQFNAA